MTARAHRAAARAPSALRKWCSIRRDDGGFTLVELLIVAVLVPLIIGAVAEAVIVSIRNDSSVTTRLNSSVNSQTTSAYFVRDVQGASQITTEPQTSASHPLLGAGPFPWQSPEVCASSAVLSSATVPATDSFILGLYRPPTASTSALSIGYWMEGTDTSTQVVRYACQVSATYTATDPSRVVVADTTSSSSGAVSANVAISPDWIQSAAQSEWASVAPATFYTGTTDIALGALPVNIPVVSTAGFTSGKIYVATTSSSGADVLTCTGLTGTSFTGCSGGSVGDYVLPENLITQSVVSGVQVAVTQPPALGDPTTAFHYSVLGAPRGGSSTTGITGPTPEGGGSTLLVLGTGAGGVTSKGTGSSSCPDGTAKKKLCVSGSITVDLGTVYCNGQDTIDATGGVSTVSSSGSDCPTSGLTQHAKPALDPIAGGLPNGGCLAPSISLATNPPADASGNLVPGIYTTAISGTLEPGLYVLEAGTSGTITLATASSTDSYYQNPIGSGAANYDANMGVLLYLPPGPGSQGCNNGFTYVGESSAPAVSLGGNAQINVAPFDTAQSEEWFAGSDGVADMWVWQDKDNTQAFTFDGTSYVNSCPNPPQPSPPCGLAYVPDATLTNNAGTPNFITGRMIVGGVLLNGTPSIVLNGS